ncbi:hypothetical protein C8Q73DRAFT_704135 [Cubamyces lactineus]|nr:hypothetical protein C8Q73DRAFT_704135 [Cubamyces lactineus]
MPWARLRVPCTSLACVCPGLAFDPQQFLAFLRDGLAHPRIPSRSLPCTVRGSEDPTPRPRHTCLSLGRPMPSHPPSPALHPSCDPASAAGRTTISPGRTRRCPGRNKFQAARCRLMPLPLQADVYPRGTPGDGRNTPDARDAGACSPNTQKPLPPRHLPTTPDGSNVRPLIGSRTGLTERA